jgi:hypothetical protein
MNTNVRVNQCSAGGGKAREANNMKVVEIEVNIRECDLHKFALRNGIFINAQFRHENSHKNRILYLKEEKYDSYMDTSIILNLSS